MNKKGTVYFFTGLAGAGKTTIGGLFYKRLKEKKPAAILFDGDKRRIVEMGNHGIHNDDAYTTEARRRGAYQMFQECRELADQGLDVVCCSISMYQDVREWNRAHIENYREIYVKVQMETLYTRNQKGLYSPGRWNVVGVDLPWDEPTHPDAVVQNDGAQSPEQIVEGLLEQFGI